VKHSWINQYLARVLLNPIRGHRSRGRNILPKNLLSMTKIPTINYPNFERPTLYSLNKGEAKLYFKEFIRLMPERMIVFSKLIHDEMLIDEWSINEPTGKNLQVLFKWLIKNISYERKNDGFKSDSSNIADGRNIWDSDFEYTIESKSNMVFAAMAWGEMFKNSLSDCDWSLNNKYKNDFNFNMPILLGKTRARLCPFSILEVLCAKVMNSEFNDDEFILTHEYWIKHY
jgi:hypothetical protein